ncbi:hypothetical protein [Marilutibacter chinensis]|uniref:Uncharacterized protein n=1 Tax=Marilutibacter chinensis TaxID=2912247 RepID=A0ABS9I051_9GAMM|nr:hypothetical protein [Lysobacter chinensis]MCF7223820.1 hypothetical protein [Lysobacter chinensis]
MASQFKQTLISTSVVGAVLGLLPAALLILFSVFDAGDDDGPAFVVRFDSSFQGYALMVFVGSVVISTVLFGLVPWLIHQTIAYFVARRRRA